MAFVADMNIAPAAAARVRDFQNFMIPPSMMHCAGRAGVGKPCAERGGVRSGPARIGAAPVGSAVIVRGGGPDAAEYLRMFLHQQEQAFNSAAYDFASSRQYTAEYCEGLVNVMWSGK
ncbi:hypothetical protein [Azospirillum sp. BE72]|uniref:hypothetical protein n=1 Tax=Azospirillum sp. BE72 TaxID=2817776 RepID=UPI0028580D4D|nr:hypothetical protein [Azospirillum sp. BE72]MDR6771577.1 hypothetical protein [Azospirillum sp. BE72]